MLRLIVALVMVPSHINAQMPPPFDPDSGCPITTQMIPDFNFEFQNAEVIHQNLGGQYCQYITNGNGCKTFYPGTETDGTGTPIAEILYCGISERNDNNQELNPNLCLRIVDVMYSCVNPCNACKTDSSTCSSWHYHREQCDSENMSECDCLVACGVNKEAPDTHTINWAGMINAPARILTAAIGDTLIFNNVNENVYLMASKDAFDNCNFEGATILTSTSGYELTSLPMYFASQGSAESGCSSGLKLAADTAANYDCNPNKRETCGSVHETEDSIFGQIKYDMGGENHFRAEFSTVKCAGDPPDYRNCDPVYWDTMVMSFLDIDGNNLLQENIILHDAFNYMMGYSTQDSYGEAFTPCVNDMFHPDRKCFSDMQIWFNDPKGVYTHLSAPGINGQSILNANSGDVILSNMNNDQTTDVDLNGNIANPEDLADLQDPQIKRAVSGVWVSPANKQIVQDELLSQEDSTAVPTSQADLDDMKKINSFQVSMGLFKRTVLFSGWASSIGGQYCQTCRKGYLNQHSCNEGDVSDYETVCLFPPSVTQGCNYNTCCSPATTSHGDPIIWTFHDECYDLNKDGLWLATSHPEYDHEVKIAVYNDYMRELQVLTKSGDLLLSINNMGEVAKNNFPYDFSQETLPCPDDMKECIKEYKEFKFDIQDFQFVVQTLRHDYLDPALKEGENGYHLDIYPKPYKMFGSNKNGYSGLYFENPLPDELEYCPGGSLRAGRDGIAYN